MSDPVNVEVLRVIAEKQRSWEAPYKDAGDPAGLGFGAAALAIDAAADEIEASRLEIARLREALAPFAKRAEMYADEREYMDGNYCQVGFTFADLRRARSAHEGKT